VGQAIDKKKLLSWLITIGLTLAVFCIPLSDAYTSQMRSFFCITVFIILMLVFDFYDTMILGILLPVSYILFGVVPAKIAFSGWLNTVSYVVIGALLFANVLTESGVIKRVSLWTMSKTGGSFNKMIYAFMLLGIVTTYLTFGNCSKLMPTIAFGFCLALGWEKKKEGVILMMVSGVCTITARLLTYYPVQMAPMVAAAQTIDPDFKIVWWQPTLYGAPIFLFCFLYAWVLTKIYKTKNIGTKGGKEYFDAELAKLGPIQNKEKKCIVYAIAIIAYLVTSEWHGFSPDYAFMVLPWIAFFPGVGLGSKETLTKLKGQMGLIFFIVGCLGIGLTAAELGVTDLLATTLTPMLQGVNKTGFMYITLVLGMAGNVLLTPLALVTSFSTPVVQLAASLDIDFMAPLLSLYYTVDMLFFPHEVPAYLYLYAFGVMKMKDFIGLHTLKNIMFLIFFGLIMIPWWKLLGIF